MGYLAFFIEPVMREKLLEKIPPTYSKIIADHVTIEFGKNPESFPEAKSIDIIGIADDGNGLQALVVAVDGVRIRPDSCPYHITWSLDPDKMAPAEFDPNPNAEHRVAQTYRPVHSVVLVRDYAEKGLVKFFERPILIGGAIAKYKEDMPVPAAANTGVPPKI